MAIAFTRWIGSPASIFLHTIIFGAIVALLFSHTFPFDIVILIFNTAVSLEAIYLALFIQMTVNVQAESIEEFEKDIDEIQEDVGEIQEDVGELQEDVEEMSEEDKAEETREAEQRNTLDTIHADLRKLLDDIERLKRQ